MCSILSSFICLRNWCLSFTSLHKSDCDLDLHLISSVVVVYLKFICGLKMPNKRWFWIAFMVQIVIPEQQNYAGCGKRTVIRYVARRLGLHVVEYNCHDLLASDKTSVALAQAFKTARRLYLEY